MDKVLSSHKGFGPGDQEWGFFDVRKGAHMFYWLFYVQGPKEVNRYDKPLVIWLQGGPGGSSTGFGNFEEIGPLYVNGTERPSTWAKHVNLLFIDNPVGAGFSYTDSNDYLTTNNVEIGRDMVAFLISFYAKFPKFAKTPLYIFCESYGGKMTVEIAKQLLAAIEVGKLKANFVGVGLGDSWISPVDSVNYWAPFLLQSGLVDQQGYKKISQGAEKVEKAVNDGNFIRATDLWGALEMTIMRETINIDFYNILYKVPLSFLSVKPKEFDDDALQALMEGPVKKALGIPSSVVHNSQSGDVFRSLSGDFMKPVTSVVEELLNNTNLQVVVLTGTLDLIVDTPGTVHWIDKLRWKGAEAWQTAERDAIVLNGYIEGYVKKFGNLYLYWVLRAGHMIPTDNPSTALEILRRTTKFDKV
ncbi:hypothetical protein RUM44_002946 [Polyplax serrata]|uniref:Carboxypeptidase n=1 Tax=Polyplax serrata TaxID=468196 RepID=A0ABR1AX97_POLSC